MPMWRPSHPGTALTATSRRGSDMGSIAGDRTRIPERGSNAQEGATTLSCGADLLDLALPRCHRRGMVVTERRFDLERWMRRVSIGVSTGTVAGLVIGGV